jgi:hypothetical protein
MSLQGWHVVSISAPDHFENGRMVPYRGWTDCIEWCLDNIGPEEWPHSSWRYVSEGVFEFRNEAHATWFKLRWS